MNTAQQTGKAYLLTQTEFGYGTSKQGDIALSPAELVRVFGVPQESDGYKVSGEYTFQGYSNTTEIWTVYDWKCTTLYDTQTYDGDRALDPNEFWKQEEPQRFSLGGRSSQGVEDFVQFLQRHGVKVYNYKTRKVFK
jgi:hypothetical protein